MPPKIRHIRPKQLQSDVFICDKCGLRPVFYLPNLSFFVCSSCASKYAPWPDDLLVLPDSHISQLLPERSKRRPYRPRKRDKRIKAQLQELASLMPHCDDTDEKQRTSARLEKANKKMLRKHFSKSAS